MNVPPIDPNNLPPPVGYVPYARPADMPYGTVEKLQALCNGYFGLNYVFIINVVLFFVQRAVLYFDPTALAFGLATILMIPIIAFLTFPQNKLIGFGKDWSPSGPLIASILMGFNSAFCFGLLGYVVMQHIAFKEMKLYGIKGGSFSMRKDQVQAQIAAMRAARS